MSRITDALNNASASRSGVSAMTVIDRLQDFRPEEQVIGAAAVFLLLCEHYGVEPQDAFTVTNNVMSDSNGKFIPEFRAVKMYVENEL